MSSQALPYTTRPLQDKHQSHHCDDATLSQCQALARLLEASHASLMAEPASSGPAVAFTVLAVL